MFVTPRRHGTCIISRSLDYRLERDNTSNLRNEDDDHLCPEVQRVVQRPELSKTPLVLSISISAFEIPTILKQCGSLGPCDSCRETIWQSRLYNCARGMRSVEGFFASRPSALNSALILTSVIIRHEVAIACSVLSGLTRGFRFWGAVALVITTRRNERRCEANLYIKSLSHPENTRQSSITC